MSKGTFYSEGAGFNIGKKMWNSQIKVLKIAPELLFPVSGMNCRDKMLIFSLNNKINLFKSSTKRY